MEARKSLVISRHYSYALNKECEEGKMREEGGEVNRGCRARECGVYPQTVESHKTFQAEERCGQIYILEGALWHQCRTNDQQGGPIREQL